MRLGLFGGSFDPVHYGHLLLAETCRESARLDRIWFVPAAQSPHKRHQRTTEPRHRREMLELAIGGHPAFEICTWEIDRGGVSFTVDTLTQLRAELPNAEVFFLMGADSLRDFPTWREPQRICNLATPLVVARPEAPRPDLSPIAPWLSEAALQQVAELTVAMPLIQLSSSDIRDRIGLGKSIRYRTPRAVEMYIESHGLYRQQAT